MSQNQKSKTTPLQFVYRILQGALIGLGAVLPGISGGVLSVIFGIYKPIMELLSNPFANFKTHVPKLIPVFIGGVIGFLGVANLLSFFLEKYPDPSVCLFIGLIAGMWACCPLCSGKPENRDAAPDPGSLCWYVCVPFS